MEIRLIGRPQILDDEGLARPVRGHQSWALLARILMTERPLSRRELSAELFGSAQDPLGALRWCLAGLRGALGSGEVLVGDPVLAALPDGTVLDVGVVDVHALEFCEHEPKIRSPDGRRLLGTTVVCGIVSCRSQPATNYAAVDDDRRRVVVNRPGMSGDFISWKDEVHGTSLEVSPRVAGARDPSGGGVEG